VRRILGKQRRRHGDTAFHRRQRVGGKQRLAAQHAVLIGEGEAHQFELVLLDRLRNVFRVARLLAGPQAVVLDEAHRGRSAARGHQASSFRGAA
jgi:hypothetical protein